MATRVHRLRPSSALSTLALRRSSSSRRTQPPRATSATTRAEYRPDDQQDEGVPAAARIFATGVGLMINAAGFEACYELNPSMRILASVIEETQDPGKWRERERERERARERLERL